MSLLRKILGTLLAVIVIGVAGLAIALSHDSPCGSAPATAFNQPMKVAVNRCYGSADVVRIESREKPVPGDHDLLIQVRASSVNPLDWHYLYGEPYLMRASSGFGTPKDIYLGTDFAGTVVAAGKAVTKFKVGDNVYGTGDGAFAQFLLQPDSEPVALMPSNVDFEQAAAVPVAGVTALQALRDKAHVHAGTKVVINGAGGGVGTYAVQIAKALGANVTAVTNTGSVDLMHSLGADRVVDYTRQDFTQEDTQYDVIFDLSGNHPLRSYRHVLSPTGVYLLGGDTDKGAWLGPLSAFAKTMIVAKFVKPTLTAFMADMTQPDLKVLADMMQAGKLKSVIDRRYPLDQVADAFRYQVTGHARGKVIVTIN